jgi:hypothetical protein
MAAIASSRGSTPLIAKKHVCITVLTRPPMPASRATRLPSITKKRSRLAMSCSWTLLGRWSQTSPGPYGLLSRKTPPGSATFRTSSRSRKENWWQATKVALLMRYAERMGRGPKRRWEIVAEPDFFES